MKKLLYLLCTLILAITSGAYPAGKTTRATAVSNNTIRTIQAYLQLDPTTATSQEFRQKQAAAQRAINTLPARFRQQYQAEITKRQAQLSAVASTNNARPSRKLQTTTPQQKPATLSVARKTDIRTAEVQESDASESFSSREMIGAVGALALILGYEFLVAPKWGTTQLGIEKFCTALYNRKNPLTVQAGIKQPDTPVTDSTEPAEIVAQADQAPNKPGFFKELGFDILLSFFGL